MQRKFINVFSFFSFKDNKGRICWVCMSSEAYYGIITSLYLSCCRCTHLSCLTRFISLFDSSKGKPEEGEQQESLQVTLTSLLSSVFFYLFLWYKLNIRKNTQGMFLFNLQKLLMAERDTSDFSTPGLHLKVRYCAFCSTR